MTIASLKSAAQALSSVANPIIGRTDMVANNAGGFVFEVDEWTKLDRFLILGTEGGTYYAQERDLNNKNIPVLIKLVQKDGLKMIDRVVEISASGRAKNNDYALLALAIAISTGDSATKAYARRVLPQVARTGTHLFHFVSMVQELRGWGSLLRKAVADWYTDKEVTTVAYQALKYQQRDGFSQRDILRLSHPNPGSDVARSDLYKYICKGAEAFEGGLGGLPTIVQAFEQAKTAPVRELVKLITDHRLSHEMIPNERKDNPAVWEALSQHMGTTALIRNLNKMTQVGLMGSTENKRKIIGQLTNVDTLKKDRIHPLQMLIAYKTYARGMGFKGNLVWTPDSDITAALEQGMYSSFSAVPSTGLNRLMAIDVSGSMTIGQCAGTNGIITAAEGAAIMAMVCARNEPNSRIFGFGHKFHDLGITSTDTLAQAMAKTNLPFSSTNPGVVIETATRNKWKIDSFEIFTDNEVNQGKHASPMLKEYRKNMGVPHAKMVMVGMAVNDFTMADPKDHGMMDVVGFDANAPRFINEFIQGSI